MKRLLIATMLMVAGVTVMLLLAPGGLGDPGPVRVVDGLSADLYRDAAPMLPVPLADHASGGGLILLAALLLGYTWQRWRHDRATVAGAVVVGAGVVVAYAVSEAVKLIVDQERPCRVLASVPDCPQVGDWSFPSNHATIAGAFAVGLAVLAPRWALAAVSVAVGVAVLRVAAGEHYPHDVAAGLVFGAAVGGAFAVALTPAATWLLREVLRRRGRVRVRS